MRKILSVILVCLLFTACSSNQTSSTSVNKAVETLGIEMESGAVGAFLNNYTLDKSIKDVKIYDSKSTPSERGLIVPFYTGSKIKIETVDYDLKSATIVPKKEVFSDTSTDDYAIDIRFVRPEGIPNLRVSIEYKGNVSLFLIKYNGKDGNPAIEYIGSIDTK